MLQTEHEFTLPLGYIDKEGRLHKAGIMRLATAADEILPQRDERVRGNPAYLTVIVLSRVIVRLGDVQHINTGTVENLFAADLEYLQDLYNTINQISVDAIDIACPKCADRLEVAREQRGIFGYPLAKLNEEMAFLAYHFHWSLDQILELEHADRRTWVGEISAINERMNGEP